MRGFIFSRAIFIILFSGLFMLTANAQAFQKGSRNLDLGMGLGWSYGWGYGARSFPAIHVAFEQGVYELADIGVISVGGVFEFKNASYSYKWSTESYKYRWNTAVIGARGALHMDFLKDDKIDTYGGAALGLRVTSFKSGYTGTYGVLSPAADYTDIDPLFGLFVGARYYFTDKFAGFGELGWGLSYLTLGLSVKL